jgi:hypothetical protein
MAKYVLIIAGGRDQELKSYHREWLADLMYQLGGKKKVLIRTGGARGIDTDAYLWAMDHNIDREPPMEADWHNVMHPDSCPKKGPHGMYDACAGFRRNERMAVGDETHPPANGLVVLPGGKGTQDMYDRGVLHGLDIYDWRKRARSG